MPEPATLHRGIRRIESGTSFTVVDGELRTKRYFHPTFPIRPVAKDEEQALYDRIADVLDDSVRMHMRADVTVGSFLSGGIDSTAIAALAKRYNPKLMTFTTGFEREGFSEIDVAAESAAAIGVEHITKVVTAEEFADAIPLVVWYLDDPVADPALVPLYFIAREARKHVKVVLSGEGADELFGGYNIYREPLSLAAFDEAADRASAARWAGCRPGCPTACAARTCCAAARSRWSSATTATPGSSGTTNWASCERRDPDLSHVAVTARAVPSAPAPPATTTSRRCSTSTCSPGCAATSWSRPTR